MKVVFCNVYGIKKLKILSLILFLTAASNVFAETCHNYDANKQALFGDLHIHTNYSFDAYFFNNLNGPNEAYQFAKGQAVSLPASNNAMKQGDTIQLERPLDFAAVTDHAEFIGGFNRFCKIGFGEQNYLCERLGEYIRENVTKFIRGSAPGGLANLQMLTKILLPSKSAWQYEKEIANDHYDVCEFTTFAAYEFSSNKTGQMSHRNVVFNGSDLPGDVVSSLFGYNDNDNTNDEWRLFDSLKENCGDKSNCDYITIPHNSNLSSGRMFPAVNKNTGESVGRNGETLTRGDAMLRANSDRLVEIFQHKGSSECMPGVGISGMEGEEAGCDFEQLKSVCDIQPELCASYCSGDDHDPLFCQLGSIKAPMCDGSTGQGASPAFCTAPNDYVRNAYLDGLVMKQKLGVNAYRQGFIASTDTHNGTPGATSEFFKGHGGTLENEPSERLGSWQCIEENVNTGKECKDKKYYAAALTMNAGGLAAVWAEENTRDSIFNALKRGESFGTSGPRMQLRMMAGWEGMPDNICTQLTQGTNPLTQGTYQGVAMGSDLPIVVKSIQKMAMKNVIQQAGPNFVVWAQPDTTEQSVPLQRIEIVKGWVDRKTNEPQIKTIVLDSVENYPLPNSECAIHRTVQGARLCKVWQDPDFDESEQAFYYARTLENPSCRWNTRMCVSKGVECKQLDADTGTFSKETGFAGYEGCCQITTAKSDLGNVSYIGKKRFTLIQERAWGSPIWYNAIEE